MNEGEEYISSDEVFWDSLSLTIILTNNHQGLMLDLLVNMNIIQLITTFRKILQTL